MARRRKSRTSTTTTLPYAFKWIDATKALQDYATAIDQFSQMAKPQTVFEAGMAAGQVVKTSMQDMIYSQPSLDAFADVAERITVWGSAKENVWVGINPQETVALTATFGRGSMVTRAEQMDAVFPVIHTVFDLQQQTHQAEEVFYNNLITRVF